MSEHELQEALRHTMAASTPPPPMSATTALTTARRARLYRRAAWLSSGAAAATVLVVAGVVFAGGPGFLPDRWSPGGPGPSVGEGTNTERPWPTGPDGQPQQDRTATAGFRYDQGVKLYDAIVDSLAAGYSVSTDADPDSLLRYHQASFTDWVDGAESWEYLASVAVAKDGKVGRLLASVQTSPNTLPTEPCALALSFWGMSGDCEVVSVGAAQVGVVTSDDNRLEQWAACRHPDGVVVFVAQARHVDEARPPLTELPLSTADLAGLAVNDRFHLT